MKICTILYFLTYLSAALCLEVDKEPTNIDPVLVDDVILKNHLREEGFTMFTVVKIHQRNDNQSLTSDLLRRRRSLNDGGEFVECQFEAFNETFELSLRFNHEISDSKLPVVVQRKSAIVVSKWQVPDCFMTGMTSRNGAVSLSYCDGLIGYILEGDYGYRLDPLDPLESGLEETVLVSRTRSHTEAVDPMQNYYSLDSYYMQYNNKTREKRAIPSSSFTIEVAIFLDEIFWTVLETGYHASTMNEKLKLVALKWNGVQSLIGLLNPDFGYDVTIKIKSIEFWQTNPDWYVFTEARLDLCLQSFCSGSQQRTDLLNVDHYHLHTGAKQPGVYGFANRPGQCIPGKCGTSADRTFYDFYVTAHELGHTLNMRHDTEAGCPASGIMDANACCRDKWISCNLVDMEAYLTDQTKSACLFEQNVPPESVDANIQSITLDGLWPGMVTSEDEKCATLYGSGWEYTDWHLDWGSCTWYSCINMNSGAAYSNMITQQFKLRGQYCSDRHVCSDSSCITWEETRIPLSKFVPIEGGWSSWSAFSSCSKNCGNGMRVQQRTCDNPKPVLSAPCVGSKYQAEICSSDACAGDSTDPTELRKQRASEVCTRFVNNNVLSPSEYDGTGDRLGAQGNAQCIVYCTPQTGFTPETNMRHGWMPDGTACTGSALSYQESKGFPRVPGYRTLCLKGKCTKFGCQNTTALIARDFCGICGGDNSTCQAIDGTYTTAVPAGQRSELFVLPAGTFMIQIWFTWSQMNDFHIEIYNSAGNRMLSSGDTPYIVDTTANPVTIGGARWTYLWWQQYLYTADTTTEELTVKIYNKNGNANTGINYGYSLPAVPTTTTTSTTTTSTSTTTSTTSTTTTTSTSTSTTTSTTSSTTISSSTSAAGSMATSEQSCFPGMIMCQTGKCIKYQELCDGKNDCGDNADESEIFVCPSVYASGIPFQSANIVLCVVVIAFSGFLIL